ncbi:MULTISPECIES: DUF6695 family protein [Sphingobacterium]|uniref:DUF6695 family protein n=1 Tax=Sphingobacterium TaxID=28453 RepID=UPI0013DC8503|nr:MULTISPECIES: DUF6695 family protein [unclassified Sphingobacterium]
MMRSFNDFAIPLAWPDQTAFGDERWMAFLKKCGIVKNLNFKVGHAAILLISQNTGNIEYYDFGRYVSPRGDGRARSKHFDPRLQIDRIATFDKSHKAITNIDEILTELSAMEEATHGGGRLFFTLAPDICYVSAKKFADQLVTNGPIPYGAIAKGNNSCSRFVAQVLVAGMHPKDRRIKKINFPETLKPSPMSNIINTGANNTIHCYHEGMVQQQRMGRISSLNFHWQLLKENLSSKHISTLGCDTDNGQLDRPALPPNLRENAQWLGGIGEGMWFQVLNDGISESHYWVESYTSSGVLINRIATICPQQNLDLAKPFEITTQMDGLHFTILQNEIKYLLKKTEYTYNKKIIKSNITWN